MGQPNQIYFKLLEPIQSNIQPKRTVYGQPIYLHQSKIAVYQTEYAIKQLSKTRRMPKLYHRRISKKVGRCTLISIFWKQYCLDTLSTWEIFLLDIRTNR